MKTSMIASAFVATAAAVSVSYDRGYDDASRSMSTVTCSDGPNGLASRFPTQGKLPVFPYIGGAPGVTWNSPLCGSCWKVTYQGHSIHMLAIDSANGFNMAFAAMNDLTKGNAEFLGTVQAEATQVDKSICGL
ncbi:related to Protein SnodProt1 [Cephalotrichum gorgonifer]|uniref:Related to Protein SnodProt1 n=1 Tax=Cephalotrichum gorgonifer TaxID=2041049 RepID=A0AAE8MQP6_9PEZI|nr:related to Protein SnodProt1 [Cephalotrichum gorgonifer]